MPIPDQTTGKVLRLPSNEHGRDYVVGDIHGQFDLLEQALEHLDFDTDHDRVISVGDLIDRGPFSEKSLQWLEHTWFYAIMGNHEQILLEAQTDHHTYQMWTQMHGGAWWIYNVEDDLRDRFIQIFQHLPYIIEIAHQDRTCGIVHANIPKHMDWYEFVQAVESGDPKVRDDAIWGRSKVYEQDRAVVRGVDRVISGHTPIDSPAVLGNHYFIDTGAVYGGDLTVMHAWSDLNEDDTDWVQVQKKPA